MHRLLFRAYNIDGAMNVAWRGARRSERSSSGGGNQHALRGDIPAAHALRTWMVLLIWEGGGLYGPRVTVACRSHSGTLVHVSSVKLFVL